MLTHKQFRPNAIAVAAALATLCGGAWADDEVADLTDPKSTISVGVGNWSNDRPQSGMYDAMPDGKTYGLFDADIVRRDNATGTWFKFGGLNLGLDNRDLWGEVLRQGSFGIGFQINRITRDDPNTYHTNLQGIGTSRLIQDNAYAATADDFANGTGRFAPQMSTLNLGMTRDQKTLTLYRNLLDGLDFNATFKHENKTGTRNWSRGGDQSGFFAVEPLDSTTRQLEAALSYATPKYQLRGGYNGSWYRNNVDNKLVFFAPAGVPYGTPPAGGSSYTYLSLPLDNQAHQLFLNGGYNFTKSTRGTFKLEYARATQNDHNPSTDILGLSDQNPPGSLNAKVITKLMQAGLTSRVTRDFSVTASLKYHDKKDKTPVFNYIDGECCVQTLPYPAYPYVGKSIRTLTGKVEGIYRFNDDYSLTAAIEEKRQKRALPVLADGTGKEGVVASRHKLNETTSRLELRRAMTETLNGGLSWVHAKRDGSPYELMMSDRVTIADPNSPEMGFKLNPISIADRTRDKIRVALDWAPIEPVSVQFAIEDGRDKYGGDYAYGLEKGKNRLYSVDLSWAVNDKLNFSAWFSHDQSKARQTGYLTTGDNRRYDLEDSANSFGLGVKWQAMSKLRTGIDLAWTRGTGKYNTAVFDGNGDGVAGSAIAAAQLDAGATTDLPSITNRHLRVSMFALYAFDKSSNLRFDLMYDRWRSNDWAWLYTDGSPFLMGDGSYVTGKPRQSAVFIGVRYIYKF